MLNGAPDWDLGRHGDLAQGEIGGLKACQSEMAYRKAISDWEEIGPVESVNQLATRRLSRIGYIGSGELGRLW